LELSLLFYGVEVISNKPKRIRGITFILIGIRLPLVWIPIPLPSFDYNRTPIQELYNISIGV